MKKQPALIFHEREGVEELNHEHTIIDLPGGWDTALGIESHDPIDSDLADFELSEGDTVRAVIRGYELTGEVTDILDDGVYVTIDDEVGLCIYSFVYSGAMFQTHRNPVRQRVIHSAVYEFEILDSE